MEARGAVRHLRAKRSVPSASSLARFAQVLKNNGTKLPAASVLNDDVTELPADTLDAAEP